MIVAMGYFELECIFVIVLGGLDNFHISVLIGNSALPLAFGILTLCYNRMSDTIPALWHLTMADLFRGSTQNTPCLY